MKIWNKIKYPLLIALIVLLLAFVRYVALAGPGWAYWLDTTLLFPLLFLRILSLDAFSSDILLDILLVAVGIGAVLFVPAPAKFGKLRRYLLRPALAAVAIVAISAAAINANDTWEDQLRQRKQDALFRDIRAFVDVADEVIAYNTHSQHFGDPFREAFPELLLETTHIVNDQKVPAYYYCDYILIDYDTHRVGFVYHRYGSLELFEYQLKAVDDYPDLARQRTIDLPNSGASLICYRLSIELDQYTDGLALAMPDGSIYAITDLCRVDRLFLGIQNAALEFIE